MNNPTRIPYRPQRVTPPGATLADLLEERQIAPAASLPPASRKLRASWKREGGRA